ncbi:PAAR domain-containing protein [Shewanella woodyi]|uniref:PAAR repeat-containing protein n=1 Tax=Shewanella woodyi (strain ATCC 51908 / MS32) TaxID=392500 RepID=B1KGS0_SHEWM|nr:PAAR domain-containing protein [Shewanella woodyi]ACA86789.1 PAAR repeat-containing protein [Shewanella woodyi ATCC 51908]
MPKAARLGDSCAGHGCMPATPIIAGSGDVSINGKPAARKGDTVLLHACPCPNMPHGIHGRSISAGSSNVSINGKPAARVGDAVGCGGSVAAGSGDVLIGDTPYKSPTHKCGENAVKDNTPLLAMAPMPILAAIKWGEPANQFITADSVVTTVKQRKARYQARKKLASSTANESDPKIKAASERLDFNNDSILRAEAAQYVYRVDENRRDPAKYPLPEAPVGLEVLDTKTIPGLENAVVMSKKSGFGAAIFKSEINDATMLTYRGTNNGVTGKKDWKTNGAQGIGKQTKQYDQAMHLARQVKRSLGKEVEIVGHSLGGGLAASAVGVTGIKGYSFNSAGLHENTVSRQGGLKMEKIKGLIQSQSVDGEVLTLLQSNRGVVAPLLAGVGSALGGTVGTAIGGILGAAILNSGAAPEAPGNMRELKSIEGGNPVTRHGMDQVIAGIEAQKKQDITTLTQYHWGQ